MPAELRLSVIPGHGGRGVDATPRKPTAIVLLITRRIGCRDLAGCLWIWHQCVAEHEPDPGGRSWLKVRSDQKYK